MALTGITNQDLLDAEVELWHNTFMSTSPLNPTSLEF
jgi:hypothetical protein